MVQINADIIGTGSVTFNVEIRTSLGTTGTSIFASDQTVTNAGAVYQTFAATDLPLGTRLYLKISNVTGIVTAAAITCTTTGGLSNGSSGSSVADIGSTAETVGGSVANGSAATASRSDHKHAITNPALDTLAATTDITTLNASTGAHGLAPKAVAPAANALNVVGIANGETVFSDKTILTTTVPSTQAFGDSASAGTNLDAAHSDHKHAIPVARIALTAALTYYVRTDGNDSNNGLANTSGGAFLTIQYAINVASALDNGGNNITIQVADGTYVSATEIDMKSFVGSGLIIIQGNVTTPSNCVLSFSGAHSNGFVANGVLGTYQIQGFQLKATNSGYEAFYIVSNSVVNIQNLDFNTGWSFHLDVETGATITVVGNYKISGGGTAHISCSAAFFKAQNTFTITLTGTPAFSAEFVGTDRCGWCLIEYGAVTFSGSATGKRYLANTNGIIDTEGGGSTFIPGNSAGSVSNGGVYE
jgi:hypothetical protein